MDANQMIHEITEFFLHLSPFPRSFGQEQTCSAALADLLRSQGNTVEQDAYGNLRCDVPATVGLEAAPLVCIQGHWDPICTLTSNGANFQIRNDWLELDSPSALGATRFLAVAAALWLLQQPFPHGPIRLLLTVGDKQTMSSVQAMSPHWLDEVRYLIGTDGFQLNQLTVGSSGGCYQVWSRRIKTIPTEETSWKIALAHFPGGHSALDLGKGRVNPLRLLGTLLMEADAEVVSFSGGCAGNVIPSDASAVIIPKSPNIFSQWQALAQELGGQLTYTPTAAPTAVWSPIDRQAALDFLLSLPSGITARLPEQPELPACSGNLGRVDYANHTLSYHVLLRGTPQQALDRAASGCALLADRCGFDLARAARYPAWTGDRSNGLAQRMSQLWNTRTGAPMPIGITHAGSALSILTQLRPELTAVGTGITIEHPYSVQERARLADLPAYVQLLQDTLEEIAQQG